MWPFNLLFASLALYMVGALGSLLLAKRESLACLVSSFGSILGGGLGIWYRLSLV